MKTKKYLFGIQFALIASIVSGCASTQMTRLGSQTYPAKAENCTIEVLSQTPTRAHEEVCLLNARGGQSVFESKSVEGLLPDLKAKACACGADAIVIKNSKEGGYNFGDSADRAEASATAIRYKTQ